MIAKEDEVAQAETRAEQTHEPYKQACLSEAGMKQTRNCSNSNMQITLHYRNSLHGSQQLMELIQQIANKADRSTTHLPTTCAIG